MSYNYQNLTNAMLTSLMPQNNKRQIISVNGVQDAKTYNLDRGENVILMDSQDDKIYIKSVDDLGKCQFKAYRCIDITDEVLNDNSVSVNKTEFDKLSKELSELKSLVMEMNNEHNVRKSEQQFKKSDS